ncbi:MAG: hypothetical protein EB059_08600 [Alphaproteobacteria bacterium]|nr:hypothetical protein [Alphaproteobacteria bacterium]
MKTNLFVTIAVCVITALLTLGITQRSIKPIEAEPAFSTVMQTHTLRCGYFIYPPTIIKDPNTGKLSGTFYDAVEAAAARMNIKVQWTKEVSFATMIEELKLGRYDAVCSGAWQVTARAPFVEFVTPLYYSGVGAYVRKGKTRIHLVSDINTNATRIAILQGEMSEFIARQQFPDAQRVSIPSTADVAQLFLQLEQNKADVVFAEPYQAEQFMASRGAVFQNIAAQKPLRVLGNSILVGKGEFKLKSMLDTAFIESLQSGEIDAILKKYPSASTSFYPVASPYSLPQSVK